jgi:NTP pyrophosphatase (non-canonical NTP hydrolase)
MDMAEYQLLAKRTSKDLGFRKGLVHAALGLTGEAGEFSDAVKRFEIYDHNIDRDNLREEIGDVLWYCAYAASVLGESLQTIARENIEKLAKRYPEQYTDYNALLRLDKIDH